jgi:hypothetical protein
MPITPTTTQRGHRNIGQAAVSIVSNRVASRALLGIAALSPTYIVRSWRTAAAASYGNSAGAGFPHC